MWCTISSTVGLGFIVNNLKYGQNLWHLLFPDMPHARADSIFFNLIYLVKKREIMIFLCMK